MVPLEVISHREVHLKPLIPALERLFERGAEDERDIRKAFCNTHVHCVSPAFTIFKVDLCFVSRSDRPIVRQDESRRERQIKITLRQDIMFFGDGMAVFGGRYQREPVRDIVRNGPR